jgi:TatD DNase family protein
MFLSGPLDEDAIATMHSLLSKPGVVAVGEVGLDSTGPNPSLQMDALRAMLRLAREADLPVVLHSEGPVENMLSLIGQVGVAPRGAVVHYFTGDAATARRYIEAGLYISLSRTLVRRPRLQKVARELPLDRLLLETDTYPMPHRATEPAHVRQVAEKLAQVNGVTLEQVARQTTANFRRLFQGG